MATPGLHALREAYPEAWIVGQLPAKLVPLLEGSGLFDEIWSVEARSAPLGSLRKEARRVASGRFELGIVIPESVSSAMRMRLGRVGRIVGFARDPLRRFILHSVVSSPEGWGRRRLVSRERYVARLMDAVGAPTPDLTLRLRVTKEEEDRLETVLRSHGLDPIEFVTNAPFVLAPGASFGASKCWPAESYAELADRLGREGRHVILLGAPGEGSILRAVCEKARSSPIVLDAVLDLGGVKALLRKADLLVANDAGARHVAAAFGTPSVIFFGPTSILKTADNLGSIEVLEREVDCRPCYKRDCPIDHRCLRKISVEAAEAAVTRVFLKTGEGVSRSEISA